MISVCSTLEKRCSYLTQKAAANGSVVLDLRLDVVLDLSYIYHLSNICKWKNSEVNSSLVFLSGFEQMGI